MESNRFWSVQKSLDIYEAWCKHHNIDSDNFGTKLFEVCHKIRPKINGLHITGVSNSGKSYILRSIRNGLMNCGRMRCQASDNFTYGSCVDKTLIYTDELWFTPQNIEEGKCILEGTETYVNVKHQNERLLKRTPSLSTSNDPWRHVQAERKAMENRMFLFTTYVPMKELKEWGTIELNPIMWLTIWRKCIDDYINKQYIPKTDNSHGEPKRSTKYNEIDTDAISPRKRKIEAVKRKLEEELQQDMLPSPGCEIDNSGDSQYCLTHMQKINKCWVLQPVDYKPTRKCIKDDKTPPTSPASFIDELPDILSVSGDETDEQEKTSCEEKKQKKKLKNITNNEYIHITNRQYKGHKIQNKLLYCNEDIEELLLDIRFRNEHKCQKNYIVAHTH